MGGGDREDLVRFLGFDLYLDETNGMSYLENPDTGIKEATGFTFEVVPVHPWPLSLIWNQNAGQFATQKTAADLVADLSAKISGFVFAVDSDPEVRVGPFTRQKMRSIRVADEFGVIGELNAGLVAQYYIRNHANSAVKLVRGEIMRLVDKRDNPTLDE